MEKPEAEEALDAASLLSRFRFLLEEDEAERFESEGTGGGASPKAEEGRREMVHSKPWVSAVVIPVSLFLMAVERCKSVVLWLVSLAEDPHQPPQPP